MIATQHIRKMSCKRYNIEVLQQGPSSKRSRLNRSEPAPLPWWQARGRREPITNPDLCFVCQRSDRVDSTPSKPESTDRMNTILSYFRKADSETPRSADHPIASHGNRSLPTGQHCQQPPIDVTDVLSPCRYCERGICRDCLIQCPNCQHDFCRLCWSHQGDGAACLECQWSPLGSPTTVHAGDDCMHVD
jgi:hypothetical protein